MQLLKRNVASLLPLIIGVALMFLLELDFAGYKNPNPTFQNSDSAIGILDSSTKSRSAQ